MLEDIWIWLTEVMADLGYWGVLALMTLESSFFPFPSEIVVPPAAANAKGGDLSLTLVILAGIAGSILGALLNYGLALWLGRPFFLRYGRWLLVTRKTFDRSERFFRRHGEIGTFVGRLVPAVRQVISFPAGLARMNLARFVFFTALGSGIWVVVLAVIGYEVGADPALVKERSMRVLVILAPILLVLVVLYVWWIRKQGRPEPEEER